jgi:Protein of unknown function (DUF1214)
MLSWHLYADLLKSAADVFETTTAPVDDQIKAELYRQFAMNLSQGYLLIFQTSAEYPEFVPFENSAFLAQPNPDGVYYYTQVSGSGIYRVSGERGNAIVTGFATGNRIIGMSEMPGKGFGNYDIDSLDIGSDGCFEVIFSETRPHGYCGNWLYLHPESDFILARQFNYDWGREVDMRLAIERLDPVPTKSRLSPEATDRMLKQLFGTYVRSLSQVCIRQVRRAHDAGLINQVALQDFQHLGNGEDWPQAYWEAIFEIADDEALVIETELPERRHYWNVQVIDGLWNQVEMLYRQTSLNGLIARVDSDGKFRAILSKQDPGFANWLDTGGHNYGMLIGRWYRCSSHPVPTITRLKISAVSDYLGDRSDRITPEERQAKLRERLIGSQLRRRW